MQRHNSKMMKDTINFFDNPVDDVFEARIEFGEVILKGAPTNVCHPVILQRKECPQHNSSPTEDE